MGGHTGLNFVYRSRRSGLMPLGSAPLVKDAKPVVWGRNSQSFIAKNLTGGKDWEWRKNVVNRA
ncbi:hypothetical protein SJ05684_c02610 [Sinorhizobium sojae CCBAU 05684]|uniref:Uncharacterized protein n=1 Tax=Sinorhizobium sojae CCBAU 05684 TaxID=716928 RepID=A0A249P8Z7_9HYPH|nr:hypothetical protein SJ05684_c02610 [Sinorhizobium sojae CCBAU 05684]